MRFELALVAIVGAASASRLGRQKEQEFLNHAVKYGRNTENINDYERRLGNYLANDAFINQYNHESSLSDDPDAVILEHNLTSDMDL